MKRVAKPAPKPNMTARYAARIVKGARSGEIIGFAAVCLTSSGAIETWYVPKEVTRRLAGEVHMLNQRAAWEAGGSQAINDKPMLLPQKKKPRRR